MNKRPTNGQQTTNKRPTNERTYERTNERRTGPAAARGRGGARSFVRLFVRTFVRAFVCWSFVGRLLVVCWSFVGRLFIVQLNPSKRRGDSQANRQFNDSIQNRWFPERACLWTFLGSSLDLHSGIVWGDFVSAPTPELAEGISACVVTRGSLSFSSLDSARAWCQGQLREPELLGACTPLPTPSIPHGLIHPSKLNLRTDS